MFEDRGGGRVRALALLAALALTLGVAACGSDDGSDSDGASAAAESGSSQPANGSSQQKQVAAAYTQFVENIDAGKWKDACASYSAAYGKAYAKQTKIAATCVDAMRFEYSRVSNIQLPKVVKVESKGPTKAIVVVRGRKAGNGTALDMVREDGEWKLDGPADQSTRLNHSKQ
jgi:hypothetical protein